MPYLIAIVLVLLAGCVFVFGVRVGEGSATVDAEWEIQRLKRQRDDAWRLRNVALAAELEARAKADAYHAKVWVLSQDLRALQTSPRAELVS